MPDKGRNFRLPRGFGQRLRDLRNKRGLSRQELAEKAGVSFNTVNNYEQEKSERVLEKNLQLLARALDVSFDELVYGRRRWRLTTTTAIVAVAVVALVATAWHHANWLVSRTSVGFERVLNHPVDDGQSVDFVDLDDDGNVDLVTYSNNSRFVLAGAFTRHEGKQWLPKPFFQKAHDDRIQVASHYYDVNHDGWKDIFVDRRWGDSTQVVVLDSRTGEVLHRSPIVAGEPSPGRDHWDGTQATIWAWDDPETGHTLALIRVNCDYSRGRPREFRCWDLTSGAIRWSHSEGAYLGMPHLTDLDGDGSVECLFDCPSTNNGGDDGHTDDAHAWLVAIELDGTPMWHRRVEDTWAHVASTVLERKGERSLVFAAVENRDPEHDGPSKLLLLDGANGAPLDSIPYTEQITNCPVAASGEDGGWDVFCGTQTGAIKKYRVTDNEITHDGERSLATETTWISGRVAGSATEPLLMVGLTADRYYLSDRDLQFAGEWRDRLERRVYPRTSFSDPAGNGYVVAEIPGHSVDVDRVYRASHTVRALVYDLIYVLLAAVIIVTVARTHRRAPA